MVCRPAQREIVATPTNQRWITDLHLLVEAIVEDEGVREGQSVWFHGVTLTYLGSNWAANRDSGVRGGS